MTLAKKAVSQDAGEAPPRGREAADLSALKELPFLRPHYDQTYLYLVPRDPTRLLVIWEVSRGTRRHLSAIFGGSFLSEHDLVLRVHDVTGLDFDAQGPLSTFEVDDFLLDKNSYEVQVVPGRSYLAELGFRARGARSFEVVARSNTTFAPRGSEQLVERYAAWGSVPCDPNAVEVTVEPEGERFNRYLRAQRREPSERRELGTWALVLHQHLPFVRHPEHDVSLEEQWFFEAVVGVYTQLIAMWRRLEDDRVDFRLTVSLSPSLLSMMEDPLLQARAARHVDEVLSLARRERDRALGMLHHAALDEVVRRAETAREVLASLDNDLTRAYRHFQDLGKLEVITCPATHALLPLHQPHPEVIRAQLAIACRQYRRVFGRDPRGVWLPENAFTPGLDDALAAEGLRWTLVSARSLTEGDTACFYGTGAPVLSPAGVAFFGIDELTRGRIWSRQDGYPGNPSYKEWYRDLGHDLPWDDLPEYWRTANVRRNTGLKVNRIGPSGTPLGEKPVYEPDQAHRTVEAQADRFVAERAEQARAYRRRYGGLRPTVVSAYDAELFGHWWEEGPAFLEAVTRRLLFEQTEIRPVTPSEVLAENHSLQRMMPGAASWGREDFFQTWVDGRAYQPNDWIWRHLYRLANQLADLATRFVDGADELTERALNQAARCLCLAGASDWPFLISTGQAVRYSEIQVVTHLDRTRELMRQVEVGEIEAGWLQTLEVADCVFPRDLDYRMFARRR